MSIKGIRHITSGLAESLKPPEKSHICILCLSPILRDQHPNFIRGSCQKFEIISLLSAIRNWNTGDITLVAWIIVVPSSFFCVAKLTGIRYVNSLPSGTIIFSIKQPQCKHFIGRPQHLIWRHSCWFHNSYSQQMCLRLTYSSDLFLEHVWTLCLIFDNR